MSSNAPASQSTAPTGTTSSSSSPPTSTSSTSSSPPSVTTSSSAFTTSSTTSSSSSSTRTSTTTSSTSQTPTTSSTSPSSTTKSAVSSTSRGASTIYITSTVGSATSTASSTNTATTTGGGALLSSSSSSQSEGLSAGGTIAVAVVVPVVSVAIIVLVLLFWWRKHKANKAAEEERRKELEEYGFNPNNGPGIAGVGVTGSYGDSYETKDSNSGYRGWGTTPRNRKGSTNLSSGVGMGISDTGSVPGYAHGGTSSEGTAHYSDGHGPSGPGENETIAALGVAPAASSGRNQEIRRGPSNASSAYSVANHSEGSEDGHVAGPVDPVNTYYDDANPYFVDGNPHVGEYGDNMYGGTGQPVIRDVQARRNTRIESPSMSYQHGNAGIAQNF